MELSTPEPATEEPAVVSAAAVVEEIQAQMEKVEEPAVVATPTEEPAVELPATAAPEMEPPLITEAPAAVESESAAPLPLPSGEAAPAAKDWVPQAAVNVRLLGKMLKGAGDRIGWTLTVQAGAFVAFCLLAAKDAPLSGLQQFLLGSIPLCAMILLWAGLANCHAAQLMLDKLEAERLQFQRLQLGLTEPGVCADTGTNPDSLTVHRRLAYWPSLIILGILFVGWLYLGLTVWFL